VTAQQAYPSIAEELADHRARLVALERSHEVARVELIADIKGVTAKLDKLQGWLMTTLAAALAGILAQLMHPR